MNSAILARSGREAGFTIMGEPLGVDLANTIKAASRPVRDILSDDGANERFWQLEGPALPDGSGIPDLDSTVRLRGALRGVLGSVCNGDEVDAADIALVNATAALATVAPRLETTPDGPRVTEHWNAASPEAMALAAAARSVLELVGGPLVSRLRECAAPKCSKLFVATNTKRIWCAPDVCGNRQRVARHARTTAG